MGKETGNELSEEGKKPKSLRRSAAMYKRWSGEQGEAFREKRRAEMVGVKHSQERRDANSRGLKGKKKSAEHVQKMKEMRGVEIYGYPLVLRKVLTDDIIDITGLQREQIWNLKKRLRRKGVLTTSPEETSELLRMAGKSESRERSIQEQRTNKFVGILVSEGFITENMWYWDRLHQLYTHYKRDLPDHIPTQIKLEGYFASKLHEAVGRKDVFIEYDRLRDTHGIFDGKEELFIKEKIAQAVVFKRAA